MPSIVGPTLFGWKCCKCGAGNRNGVGIPCVSCGHKQPCNDCKNVFSYTEARQLDILDE